MARDIETTVVVDGDEICEIVEDYLTDSDYITGTNLDDELSDRGVLTENDSIWDLVQYDVESYVTTELSDYFSSDYVSDRIQEQMENTLPEWMLTQLVEMPADEQKRCGLGKAFGEAVNKVVATTPTNVEWATRVEALEARVFALEEVIYAMHNTWKEVNPRNPESPSSAARETYAAAITNGLS
jgi:hypothetical protein